ncbi:hypothetical protein DWV12_17195 [Clostridium botulinum]|jgi:hypothetical protein|uniref:hypothetical protein n=1 Tax=Bacillota TaxID=1239 RepID=UPI00203FC96F|nr:MULTISPECIES: hypothetical protein [Bacillota]MCS6109038.1 hypothetical protein [Clostridium botulinum]MCS6168342.1 hypothetical protein [Clostridium botulinum]MCT4443946.1 hypothetical protein [Lactiplantibacillus argentoratensis]
MKANVVILNEVFISFPSDWKLTFQKVVYMYSDGNSEDGFRFIWRRPDGHLQAARGQARIPQRQDLEKLTKKAEDAGWY